jgi:succinate dehydrogenase cytochrome b556 subunit
MRSIEEKRRSGTWIGQAITGVLLVILLSLHMIVHHFVVEGGLRTYEQVLAYIGNPLVVTIEILFLVVVTYHAMVGVRAILFDLPLNERQKGLITRALTVVGVVIVGWGVFLALWLFRMARLA